MSYGLEVYLVDLTLVRGAIGSGDENLLREIGVRFEFQMESDDEYFRSEIERGAPTRYESLRAVIEGGPFDVEYGHQYGFAYEMICDFHGDRLFNNHFVPFSTKWADDLDWGFDSLGMTAVRLALVVHGIPPDPIPPGDLPRYSEWSVDECRAGLAQWEASTPDRRARLDPYVLRAIESCVDWMRAAVANDLGIAIFMA